MPNEIWKVTAATKKYLENCQYHTFKELAESQQVEIVNGQTIIKVVQKAQLIRAKSGKCACFDCITAGDIDALLAQEGEK